jgi:hypothetical protein
MLETTTYTSENPEFADAAEMTAEPMLLEFPANLTIDVPFCP